MPYVLHGLQLPWGNLTCKEGSPLPPSCSRAIAKMKYRSSWKRFTWPLCNWSREERCNRHLWLVNTLDLALNLLLSGVKLIRDSVFQAMALTKAALGVGGCPSGLWELTVVKGTLGSQDWVVLKFHHMLKWASLQQHPCHVAPQASPFREVHFMYVGGTVRELIAHFM